MAKLIGSLKQLMIAFQRVEEDIMDVSHQHCEPMTDDVESKLVSIWFWITTCLLFSVQQVLHSQTI